MRWISQFNMCTISLSELDIFLLSVHYENFSNIQEVNESFIMTISLFSSTWKRAFPWEMANNTNIQWRPIPHTSLKYLGQGSFLFNSYKCILFCEHWKKRICSSGSTSNTKIVTLMHYIVLCDTFTWNKLS